MRIECESCRELVPLAEFATSPDGVAVRCPSCGASMTVPVSTGRQDVSGHDRSPGSGPEAQDQARLGSATGGAPAGATAPGLSVPAPGLPVPEGDEEARRLFAEAEAAWEDPRPHDRFVEHCLRAAQLPYAAACYRERLRRDPADAVARAQQERIVRAAEAACLARGMSQPQEPLPNRGLLVGLVVALFVVLILFLTAPLWRWWN